VTAEVTTPATCTEMGETTYTSGAFENEAFTVQTKTLTDVEALGHDWGEVAYVWNDDNTAVYYLTNVKASINSLVKESVEINF
jgi:hypothetical protein